MFLTPLNASCYLQLHVEYHRGREEEGGGVASHVMTYGHKTQ